LANQSGGNAGGGQRNDPSPPPHDSTPLPFDVARRILVAGLPSAEPLKPLSAADYDAEVEQLLKIGLYTADRWAAQRAVPLGLAYDKRVQDALDHFTYGYMRKIQKDAKDLLDDYLDRKRPVLDSGIVRQELEALRINLKQDIMSIVPEKKHHWRPEWLRWLLAELGAGPVAAIGVILVAVLIHFVDPGLEKMAGHEAETIFGVSAGGKSAPK
jgi:hypothetical protein